MGTTRLLKALGVLASVSAGVVACSARGSDTPTLNSIAETPADQIAPTAGPKWTPVPPLLPTATGFTPTQHVEAAWFLFERGQYRDAVSEARQAAMADPQNPLALHARGYLTYIVDGAREAALSDLRKARELGPEHPQIVLDLLELQTPGIWGASLRVLLDAAETTGASEHELLLLRARIEAGTGDYGDAADLVNEALEMAATPEERNKALELRAWYEIQQGLTSTALTTYQQIDESAPAPTVEMGRLLATWLSGARDPVRQEMVNVLDPYRLGTDPDAEIEKRIEPMLGQLAERTREELQEDVLDRAEVAWSLSGYEAAIEIIEESFAGASIPPQTHVEFWKARGEIYAESGRFELAAAAYSEALRSGAGDVGARAGRAAAYLELGRYEDAKADASRVGEFSGTPGTPDQQEFAEAVVLTCEVESRAEYGLGNFERGASRFAGCEALAALIDRRAGMLAAHARAQLEHGMYEAALHVAARAVDTSDSTLPETRYAAYGAALVANGRFEEAVQAYEQATRPIDYGDRLSARQAYVERLVLLELMGDQLAAWQFQELSENLADYIFDRKPLEYAQQVLEEQRAGMEALYEAGLEAVADG